MLIIRIYRLSDVALSCVMCRFFDGNYYYINYTYIIFTINAHRNLIYAYTIYGIPTTYKGHGNVDTSGVE